MTRNFFNYYDVDENEKILGQGAFGTVRRCIQRTSGKAFAVKKINSKCDFQDVRKGANLLRKLKHPNIVVLHDSFEGEHHIYLIFDLVVGGELYEDITARKTYSETNASDSMQQNLEAINYCHQKGIVHSDLKPENILLESKRRGSPIKIADFGLAFEVRGDERSWHGGVTTYTLLSPEMVNKKPYGKPIDMWACGVILYNLLVGDVPFHNKDRKQTNALIAAGVYKYPPGIEDTITPVAKDLIRRMLCVDSYKRFTAIQALRHPWIYDRKRLVPKKNLPQTVVNLKKFNARRKFKAGILATMAANRFVNSPIKNVGGIKRNVSTDTVKGENSAMYRQLRRQEILAISIKLIKACNIGDNETIAKLCDPYIRDILVGMKHEEEMRKLSSCRRCTKTKTEMLDPYVFLLGDNSACITYLLLTNYYCEYRHCHSQLKEETRVWHKQRGKWKLVHFHASKSNRSL